MWLVIGEDKGKENPKFRLLEELSTDSEALSQAIHKEKI